MKYLKLHYLIWYLLAFVYTMIDLILWSALYILYVLWNFKIPKYFWKECHMSTERSELRDGFYYEDENVFETFKRRCRGDIGLF